MPELIYLREFPGAHEVDRGHVVGMTMPLQEGIRKRWDAGELHRVTETGERWPEGNVLPGEERQPEPEPEPEAEADECQATAADEDPFTEPVRPRGNARKEEWVAYAVALGAMTEEEASAMSQGEIRAQLGAGDNT
jgi:hypothetical protein